MSGPGWAYAWRACLWTFATIFTLGGLLPWRESALERYKMRHLHYGDLPARFEASGWTLFKRGWWLWLLAFLIIPIPFIYPAYRAFLRRGVRNRCRCVATSSRRPCRRYGHRVVDPPASGFDYRPLSRGLPGDCVICRLCRAYLSGPRRVGAGGDFSDRLQSRECGQRPGDGRTRERLGRRIGRWTRRRRILVVSPARGPMLRRPTRRRHWRSISTASPTAGALSRSPSVRISTSSRMALRPRRGVTTIYVRSTADRGRFASKTWRACRWRASRSAIRRRRPKFAPAPVFSQSVAAARRPAGLSVGRSPLFVRSCLLCCSAYRSLPSGWYRWCRCRSSAGLAGASTIRCARSSAGRGAPTPKAMPPL